MSHHSRSVVRQFEWQVFKFSSLASVCFKKEKKSVKIFRARWFDNVNTGCLHMILNIVICVVLIQSLPRILTKDLVHPSEPYLAVV